MIDEIEEEIKFEYYSPVRQNLTDSWNYERKSEEDERREAFDPVIDTSIEKDVDYMQTPGQAMELEMARFDDKGFDFDILGEIQRSLSAGAMSAPDSLTADLFDALGIDPESAYEEATGHTWISEAELRGAVETGRLADRERQAIVRRQSSFTTNFVRDSTDFARAVPMLVTAGASFAQDVKTHAGVGGLARGLPDWDALANDARKVKDFGGMALDEIASSGMAMATRPASYLGESPIDFLGWTGIAAPIGAYKGAKVAAKAYKNPALRKSALKRGYVTYRNNTTLDSIRGAGAMAAAAIEKVPGGKDFAQLTYDLYAGTPAKFKEIKQRFNRTRNADIQYIEEVILEPLSRLKDTHTETELKQLYIAMVGNLDDALIRKTAINMLREGGRAEEVLRKGLKVRKKTGKKKKIEEEVDEFNEVEQYADIDPKTGEVIATFTREEAIREGFELVDPSKKKEPPPARERADDDPAEPYPSGDDVPSPDEVAQNLKRDDVPFEELSLAEQQRRVIGDDWDDHRDMMQEMIGIVESSKRGEDVTLNSKKSQADAIWDEIEAEEKLLETDADKYSRIKNSNYEDVTKEEEIWLASYREKQFKNLNDVSESVKVDKMSNSELKEKLSEHKVKGRSKAKSVATRKALLKKYFLEQEKKKPKDPDGFKDSKAEDEFLGREKEPPVEMDRPDPPRAESPLVDTEVESFYGGKTYEMNIDEDVFVHHTTKANAEKILKNKKLLFRSPESPGEGAVKGIEAATAISLIWGAHAPLVQRGNVKDLVTIKFQTKTKPSYGSGDEVVWHEDVALVNPEIISYDDAVKRLKGNKDVGESDYVNYTEAKKDRGPVPEPNPLPAGGEIPLIRDSKTGKVEIDSSDPMVHETDIFGTQARVIDDDGVAYVAKVADDGSVSITKAGIITAEEKLATFARPVKVAIKIDSLKVPTGSKVKRTRTVDEFFEEVGPDFIETVKVSGRDRASRLIDSVDNGGTFLEWTYDGIPMTSSEFILDTDIQKWNENLINYAVKPDAPKIVQDQAERLLALKRKLFKEGLTQTKFKVNRDPDVPEATFLAEDYFKALAASYLPISAMANKSKMSLKEFFRHQDKASKQQDAIGSLGRTRDDAAYTGSGKFDADAERVVLAHENFIDALELSLPKTSDVIRRYKYYSDLSKDVNIASEKARPGWVKMDGGTAMKREDVFGGDVMRYGALEGMYVPKRVRRVIRSTERHIRESDSAWQKALGQHRRFLNIIKHNKLIANTSTHVNNVIGIWAIMNLENISFIEYMQNAKQFRNKWDDPTYKALAGTGRMPKSARGFGDLTDVTNAISNVKNPKQFFDIMMKEIEGLPPKEALKLRLKGAYEFGMQSAEFVSYRGLGINGNMGKFFTAADRLARYTLFKSRLKSLAKKKKMPYDKALKNKRMVDDASRFSEDAMLDYSDLPLGVQVARESGLSPFIAYPYRATKYFMEYPLRKGKTYTALSAGRKATEGLDTPEERERRRSFYPDDFGEPLGANISSMLGYDDPINLSTRYFSPNPIVPRETLGMNYDIGANAELFGEDPATYGDPMSSVVGLQEALGVAREDRLAIPDTMTTGPFIDAASAMAYAMQGEGQKAVEKGSEALEGVLPPYVRKLSGPERAVDALDVVDDFEFKGDQSWGEKMYLKDKIGAAIGLRILPETNQHHARRRGGQALKRVSGKPRNKDKTIKKRMQIEGAAVDNATRRTLY